MRVCNVVQRLERQADELEITGSNPLESIPFFFLFLFGLSKFGLAKFGLVRVYCIMII